MKKVTVFLIGVIAGTIIFSSSVTFATTGKKNVNVAYSNIKMVINGQLLKTGDEPFLLDGRVFVPLRAVAESLDQKVGWEKGTVLIGKENQSLILTDLVSPSKGALIVGDHLKVNNKEVRGFYALGKQRRTSGKLDFFVQNKGIKEVSGSVALDDSNSNNVKPAKVTILKDGKVAWEKTISKGQEPLPVNIKMGDDINHLTIELSNLDETKVDFIDFTASYK